MHPVICPSSSGSPSGLSGRAHRLGRDWSGSLATAISLTLAFIPRILDEGATIRDAAFSRGLGERRSLFRRAMALGLPLADATIRRADLTTEALLSRCYTDNPTPLELRLRFSDVLLTLMVILPPLALTLV